ncbi:DUF99 family protein [Halobellus sp. EA9]|uniref:endonuclease dU n=1 Tax=Halobellus sp. EA9 TaxID=3421647 RepID=UPI003EC01254
MKPGTRALGIAESTDEASGRCVFCGAVVRADRTVDGVGFATATVGGLDATDAVCDVVDRTAREDVQYVLLSGVAPAWFNLVDLEAVVDAADRPVCAVSYEDSPGLETALREHFDGDARDARFGVYEGLPPRREMEVNDETVFVRGLGLDGDDAERVVRGFTPAGGRPEPLRVARLAARGAREWRARDDHEADEDGEDRHG